MEPGRLTQQSHQVPQPDEAFWKEGGVASGLLPILPFNADGGLSFLWFSARSTPTAKGPNFDSASAIILRVSDGHREPMDTYKMDTYK